MLPKRTWRAERICLKRFATIRERSANWKQRVPVLLTILASSSLPVPFCSTRAGPKKDYALWNRRWRSIHEILICFHGWRLATSAFDVTRRRRRRRSEEHTSELQSLRQLVCRIFLE